MAVVFAEHELHNACQLLFGKELQVSRGFLEYLQLSGIKSAYRKKAFETHPDTITNTNNQNRADLFMAVQQAYESLVSFIDARKNGYIIQTSPARPVYRRPNQPPPPSPKRPTASGFHRHTQQDKGPDAQKAHTSARQRNNYANRSTATFHKGSIPARKLLFGHYLYYSGLANWQTITKALIWQKTNRPRLGELGCRYGWLNNQQVLHILRKRNLADSFGQSAIDLGLLTPSQLKLLLYQQKRLQKKFGEYFVEANLISGHKMDILVKGFYTHNRSIANSKHTHRTM